MDWKALYEQLGEVKDAYLDPLLEKPDSGAEILQKIKDKELGKDWWKEETRKLNALKNLVPPEGQEWIGEKLSQAGESLNKAWKGAETVENWTDPGDVLAAGTAHTINLANEGIGLFTDGLTAVAHHGLRLHKPVAGLTGTAASMYLTPRLLTGAGRVINRQIAISKLPASERVVNVKSMLGNQIPSEGRTSAFLRRGGLFSRQPKSNLAATQYTDELLALQRAEAGLPPVPGKVNALLSVKGNVSKNLGIEKWSKALDLVETGTGDPMRRASGMFLSSGLGPLGYTQTGAYTGKALPAITNIHHAGFLEKLKRIPVAHSSFQEVKAAAARGEIIPSPIVEGLEKQKGIKMGNYTENTADVLETLQGPHKQAIQRQISEQIDLIHPDTANDLRSTTGVNLPDLTPKQLEQIESFKKLWPDEPFPEDQLPALTKKNFREIRIIHQNGKVEKWTPSNLDEFIDRYNIVAQKVGAGIGEKISRKSMKISPKDEIFSSDHSTIHNYTERLEITPGNPVYEAEQAIVTGKINTMSVDDAIELEYKSIEMMERVLGNTLKARYKHVLAVFKEKYPKGMPTYGGYAKWKDLGTDARRRFFRENVNEIARRGGLKRPISFKQSTRPLTGWDKGLTDVFNWTPQTLKNKLAEVPAKPVSVEVMQAGRPGTVNTTALRERLIQEEIAEEARRDAIRKASRSDTGRLLRNITPTDTRPTVDLQDILND